MCHSELKAEKKLYFVIFSLTCRWWIRNGSSQQLCSVCLYAGKCGDASALSATTFHSLCSRVSGFDRNSVHLSCHTAADLSPFLNQVQELTPGPMSQKILHMSSCLGPKQNLVTGVGDHICIVFQGLSSPWTGGPCNNTTRWPHGSFSFGNAYICKTQLYWKPEPFGFL